MSTARADTQTANFGEAAQVSHHTLSRHGSCLRSPMNRKALRTRKHDDPHIVKDRVFLWLVVCCGWMMDLRTSDVLKVS